jgi:hypothetical protein
MAICLQHQAVFQEKKSLFISVRAQFFIGLILVLALSFKIWVKLCITEVGYEVARLRQAIVELSEEKQELELQRSILRRPDHLSRSARERLALSSFDRQTSVTLQVNSSIGGSL